ncbi:hypothetical protein K7X08_018619 [Anisodus acutangulus]|uniref:Uncharacterized protein n=1 Tax=Anisodus acutangulus TaxID=402998 RepID=A0A9Q1LW06_9SOLA|nr:hypothetical protein K7X08_018619 [Anisodus acutangulus]
MGCVSSKQATSHSPAHDSSLILYCISKLDLPLWRGSKRSLRKKARIRIKFGRLTEGEHLAAGWHVWLTAIDGWMPLKSNMFQKLEKYFNTKPYACDSSSLPKYPPNKEIDAKFQEEARRKRASSTVKATETSRNSRKARKALQEPSNFCKVVPTEEVDANVHGSHRNYGSNAHISKGRRATISRISMKPLSDTISETSQMTDESQGKQDSAATRLYPPPNSRSQKLSVFDPSGVLHAGDTFDSNMQDNDDFIRRTHTFKHHSIHRKHGHHELPDSFDSSDQELSADYNGQQGRVGFSGPLLCQSQKFDSKQDSQTRKPGRRARFYGDI